MLNVFGAPAAPEPLRVFACLRAAATLGCSCWLQLAFLALRPALANLSYFSSVLLLSGHVVGVGPELLCRLLVLVHVMHRS